jgi:p-aminobenzoyl-glutamate transporter AbgT
MNGWNKVGEWFANVRESIYNVFTKMPENFLTIGKNLITGLGNGIVEGAKAVVEKAKEVAGNVLDAVKGFFGVASPSKVFHQIGGYLMEGLANGVEDETGMVEKAMREMANRVTENVPSPQIDFSTAMASRAADQGRMFAVPRQEMPRMMTVILELDRMQLARAVYQLNNQETQRVGMKIAGGYA